MHAHHGDVAAGFYHILAHRPSGGHAHGFDGAIHAVFAHNSFYFGRHIAIARVDGVGGAERFGHFEAVFIHIAHNNHRRAVKLRRHQHAHAHGPRAGDKHGVARFHIAVLHADFVAGGQHIAQKQGDFIVYIFRQRNQAVVCKRRAYIFGLCAVDHITQNPAAVAAM